MRWQENLVKVSAGRGKHILFKVSTEQTIQHALNIFLSQEEKEKKLELLKGKKETKTTESMKSSVQKTQLTRERKTISKQRLNDHLNIL